MLGFISLMKVLKKRIGNFYLYEIILFFTMIALDQVSKIKFVQYFKTFCSDINTFCSKEILPVFSFTFVCNKGVSFGMFNSIKYGSVILSVVAIFAVVMFLGLMIKSNYKNERLAILFILSGAIGNLIDRIHQACVTDFIHLHYNSYHFPVFNLADCFVTIGGAIIIFSEIKKYFSSKKH